MTQKTELKVMQLSDGLRLGVILEQTVEARLLGGGLYAHGAKRPVYILLSADNGPQFWKPDGEQASFDQLAKVYPTELAEFMSGA